MIATLAEVLAYYVIGTLLFMLVVACGWFWVAFFKMIWDKLK